MANENEEVTPLAITYAEVRKAHGKNNASAEEAWRKIGEITGAGHVPPSEYATIDITDLAPGKVERINKIAFPEQEEEPVKDTSTNSIPADSSTAKNIDETAPAAEDAASASEPDKDSTATSGKGGKK